MNHIVTGSDTFIGKHLCDRLRGLGYSVLEWSRSATFEINESSTIWHVGYPPGAATSSPGRFQETISGASFVHRLARDRGARLVIFSSVNVYGRVGIVPLYEEDHLRVSLPYTGRTCSQVGNIAVECMAMADDYQRVQIIRPENVAGLGQDHDAGFVLPRFDRQARAGESLTVYGDGCQVRTFCSVHDLIDFCVLLLNDWPAEKGIWNVGGRKKFNKISMLSLASLFAKKYGTRKVTLEIESGAEPDGYTAIPGPVTDWRKASAHGYNPVRTLESIISEMKAQ